MKWVIRIVVVAGLLVALVLAGMRWLGPTEVQVTAPVRGEAVQAIYATGTVEAGITVRVAPQLSGRLVALLADEGDVVKAGQVLARFDDSDVRASLSELQARARYAGQQFERVQALSGRGYVSADQLQQARANLDAARATLQRTSEQQKFMTLKAQVAGRIIRRDGEVGDFIPVNQPVFYLARGQVPPRIDADVDEEDIAQVKIGQDVLVRADAFPDKTFTGRVTEITPKGDPVARNYRVRVGLPADTPLMIGMTAETNIIVARRANALLVPSTALSGEGVWLLRDKHVVQQKVVVGAKGPERTEIISGIGDKDVVLVQPPATLKAGQRVRVKTSPAAAPAKAKGATA
ncbi:MAG: efflux RND transporter periplasmic adaptor subunit [bacterium]|nr:efflux RND transporter periplasmic adaptor subunit [bacterium]